MSDAKSTSINDLRTGSNTNVVSQVLEKYQHMEGNGSNTYTNDEQESNISEELNSRQMDLHSYQPPPMQNNMQPEYPQEVLVQEPEKSFMQKMQNEFKEPLIVLTLFVLLNYKYFDKFLITYIKKLGNDYGELNFYGIISKAIFAALLFYLINRAVKL